MKNILNLISINAQTNLRISTTFNQPISNLFRICDIILQSCRIGFISFLILCRHSTFSYIGTSKCTRQRINQHNFGFGSSSTTPLHLRPYTIYAYIYGLNGNRHLRSHIEHVWQRSRDFLLNRNVFCRNRLAIRQ